MRTLVLVLALALPTAAQPQARALETRDALFGWEAVGRVDMGPAPGIAPGFCTGTLIAPELVLTAAHCLFDGDTPRDPRTIRFRAGMAGGQALAEAAVAAAVAHPAYVPGGGKTSVDSVRADVALLRLAEPIPSALAAPFRVDAPAAGDQVSVLSYARGREDTLARERECRVQGREAGLLAFDCDVTFGASGAPVFQRTGPAGGGRMRIVSIISAGTEGAERLSFGPDLVGAVALLKSALAAGRVPQPAGAAPEPRIRRVGAGEAARDSGARFVRPRANP